MEAQHTHNTPFLQVCGLRAGETKRTQKSLVFVVKCNESKDLGRWKETHRERVG